MYPSAGITFEDIIHVLHHKAKHKSDKRQAQQRHHSPKVPAVEKTCILQNHHLSLWLLKKVQIYKV